MSRGGGQTQNKAEGRESEPSSVVAIEYSLLLEYLSSLTVTDVTLKEIDRRLAEWFHARLRLLSVAY